MKAKNIAIGLATVGMSIAIAPTEKTSAVQLAPGVYLDPEVVQVTYGGNTYNIQALTTTYSHSPIVAQSISQSFWWHNQAAAQSAASQVKNQLQRWQNDLNPFFAYNASSYIGNNLVDVTPFDLPQFLDTEWFNSNWNPNVSSFRGTQAQNDMWGTRIAFSTLASGSSGLPTSVPEPFTIIGTLVGGTAALRMRKKLKSQTSNSSNDRNS